MPEISELVATLRAAGRTLLGFSGGVDSSLLAVAGRQALGRDDFLAVIGRSASYPEAQYARAREIAAQFDVRLLEIATHELDDPRYLANPTNRCYFCKSELWTRLQDVAREGSFAAIIDGTNADDLGDHRPGLAAAAELRVRSPLAELGWTKDDVRSGARELGIPVWNAPAAPCLSSRVRYGLEITPERLRQVEQGEEFLRSLGVAGDLRVRHLGATARIETLPAEIPVVERAWHRVTGFFEGLGFGAVELDPKGYRRGSLLVLDPPG